MLSQSASLLLITFWCWQWGLPAAFSQKLCAQVRILSSSVPVEVLIVLSLRKRTAKPTFGEHTLALEWSNMLPRTHSVALGKSQHLCEPDSSPARWGLCSLPHGGVAWIQQDCDGACFWENARLVKVPRKCCYPSLPQSRTTVPTMYWACDVCQASDFHVLV